MRTGAVLLLFLAVSWGGFGDPAPDLVWWDGNWDGSQWYKVEVFTDENHLIRQTRKTVSTPGKPAMITDYVFENGTLRWVHDNPEQYRSVGEVIISEKGFHLSEVGTYHPDPSNNYHDQKDIVLGPVTDDSSFWKDDQLYYRWSSKTGWQESVLPSLKGTRGEPMFYYTSTETYLIDWLKGMENARINYRKTATGYECVFTQLEDDGVWHEYGRSVLTARSIYSDNPVINVINATILRWNFRYPIYGEYLFLKPRP